MSLQVLLHAPGLHMDALLRPEALPEIIALIQRWRVEEAPHRTPSPTAVGRGEEFGPAAPGIIRRRMLHEPEPTGLSDEGAAAMTLFRSLTWEYLTALLPGKRFATKLLLLTAWLEAHANQPVFKSEVRSHFARTGAPFPANPGRDMQTLIVDGLILKSSDRQHLSLSEAGWKEAAQWLDSGGTTPGAVAQPA